MCTTQTFRSCTIIKRQNDKFASKIVAKAVNLHKNGAKKLEYTEILLLVVKIGNKLSEEKLRQFNLKSLHKL